MTRKMMRELEVKPETSFIEFRPVTLRRAVTHQGVTVPAGTRGVIVHAHDDGVGYEVEFSSPKEMVLSLAGKDIEVIRSAPG